MNLNKILNGTVTLVSIHGMNKENSSEKVSGDQNEPPFSLHQADIDNINAFAARQAAEEKVSALETRKHTMDCLGKGDASACPICKPINDAAYQRDRDELHKEQDQLLENEYPDDDNVSEYTNAQRAAPATPQHSPLPWINNGGRIEVSQDVGATLEQRVVATVGTVNEQSLQNTANARLIVASVNNADKLAAALRYILDAPRNEQNAITLLGRVEATLAAYEKEAAQ